MCQPPTLEYLTDLLGAPRHLAAETAAVRAEAELGERDLLRLLKTLKEESSDEAMAADAALRLRIFGYARDVGLSLPQSYAILKESGGLLTHAAFLELLGAVAIAARARIEGEARRIAVVAEATSALASAALSVRDHILLRCPPSAS